MIGVYYLHLFIGNTFVGWLAGFLETMPGREFWALHAALVACAGCCCWVQGRVRQTPSARRGGAGAGRARLGVGGFPSAAQTLASDSVCSSEVLRA